MFLCVEQLTTKPTKVPLECNLELDETGYQQYYQRNKRVEYILL